MSQSTVWVPNICYEEEGEGFTQGLPFIEVPADKEMPNCLFFWEMRDYTGEDAQPGEKSAELRSYASMEVLKKNLSPFIFDEVRMALGLKPLQEMSDLAQSDEEKEKNIETLINNINNTPKEEEKDVKEE